MIILVVRDQDNEVARNKVINAYKTLLGKELVIEHDSNGKPTCNRGYISISHTEGMYIAAISDEAVGIDVERKTRKISPRLGSIKEWTQREAYGKFLGVGINKEVLDYKLPLDLIGELRISQDFMVSVCSADKVYIVHDIL